jgi:hypothetical protein
MHHPSDRDMDVGRHGVHAVVNDGDGVSLGFEQVPAIVLFNRPLFFVVEGES